VVIADRLTCFEPRLVALLRVSDSDLLRAAALPRQVIRKMRHTGRLGAKNPPAVSVTSLDSSYFSPKPIFHVPEIIV